MKYFGRSIWTTGRAQAPATDLVQSALGKLRAFAGSANGDTTKPSARGVSYTLKPALIRTFATAGFPFLTFYEFNELTGWYRDTYFAPEHVDNYELDAGRSYTVWTHETTSIYRRHIFLDALEGDVTLSFEVPSLDTASWFPLRIQLFDQGGLYFRHDQKLVVDRLSDGASRLTSWKKIPDLKASLHRLHGLSTAAG